MKATTTKKILIGAVAALCVTTIAGVTALAVYTNRQLNAENTLTVGKEVDTVVISGGKNYFFRQTPTVEGLISGIYTAKLAEVTESVGKKAISKMDQGKTGKCYSDFHLSTLFD